MQFTALYQVHISSFTPPANKFNILYLFVDFNNTVAIFAEKSTIY